MTVQELINELNKIEDKSEDICITVQGEVSEKLKLRKTIREVEDWEFEEIYCISG